MLWLANGIVFFILLFATGQWQKITPTSWDGIPHAASVAIQYLSLGWPLESGWVAYDSLQVFAYFITVFVAAPVDPVPPDQLGVQHQVGPRSLHFLVLCWFLFFILVHVTLVVTTGVLRNLNHMYASNDTDSWTGFAIFVTSMVVLAVAWVAATPVTYRQPRLVRRVGYALIGPVQRLFEHIDSQPGRYTEKDISPLLGQRPRTRKP